MVAPELVMAPALLVNLHTKLQLLMDLLAHNNNGLTLFADHLDNLDQLVHKELPDNLDQQEHLDLAVLLDKVDKVLPDHKVPLELLELLTVVEQLVQKAIKEKLVQLVQLVHKDQLA
jgi:hypothetical protein